MFRMTSAIYDRIALKLSTDTGSIAHATDAVKVCPITGNFTPSIDLAYDDLSDKIGELSPIDLLPGAQESSVDPVTGDAIVELILPEGGLRWELSSPADPAKVVYGFAMLNNAGNTLLSYVKLTTPVTLTLAGHAVECETPKFRIPRSAF